MSTQPDPFDALRSAWKAQTGKLPAEQLAAMDKCTQRVVRGLQDAWTTLVCVPPPKLGAVACRARLIASGVLPKARLSRWQALPLVGFAAFAAASLAVFLAWPTHEDEPLPTQVATSHTVASEAISIESGPIAETGPSTSAKPFVPKITTRPDGFEMRSGKVRLVLLDNSNNQTR